MSHFPVSVTYRCSQLRISVLVEQADELAICYNLKASLLQYRQDYSFDELWYVALVPVLVHGRASQGPFEHPFRFRT